MIKVLIVDDERDVKELFLQRFRREIKEGLLMLHFAFSAEEALEFLNTATAADIVLILSDINMPGMNGLELLRILKEEYAHLHVCMITAYDDKEYHDKAMNYGAEDYLTKPIDFQKLKSKILSIKPNASE